MGLVTQSTGEPRVLLVSQRALQPTLSRCTLYEMEDVVAAVEDADIAVPMLRNTGLRFWLERASQRLDRRFGWTIKASQRAGMIHLDRDYELFFFHGENVNDTAALDAVQDWRARCGIAICRIEEMWLKDLCYRRTLERLNAFDLVLLGCEATAPELAKILTTRVAYMAPGVDALTFTPPPTPPSRTIDVLWIGRRAPRMHQALLDHARRNPDSFCYVFDTREGNSRVTRPDQHRAFLADQIHRTRYFVVNHGKGDAPHDTAGQRELGYRFFEGAAGGAALIGYAPDIPSYHAAFDWPDAVAPMPYDCENPLALIRDLDDAPQRVELVRQRNIAECLRRHDYAHRWASTLELVGATPPPGLKDRLARLERLAHRVAPEPYRSAVQGA
ncbi:MAG: glycosyltransferase [Planctomycetota bacterium]